MVPVKANLVAMSGSEILSLREAAAVAEVSRVTMLKWCRKFDIGEFDGDRWRIRRPDLQRIVRARKVFGKIPRACAE